MINVLFFASLKETLDCDGLEITDSEIDTVAKLRTMLASKGDVWASSIGLQGASSNTLVAVNQAMSGDDTALKAGDEVAFFPPVTGG